MKYKYQTLNTVPAVEELRQLPIEIYVTVQKWKQRGPPETEPTNRMACCTIRSTTQESVTKYISVFRSTQLLVGQELSRPRYTSISIETVEHHTPRPTQSTKNHPKIYEKHVFLPFVFSRQIAHGLVCFIDCDIYRFQLYFGVFANPTEIGKRITPWNIGPVCKMHT